MLYTLYDIWNASLEQKEPRVLEVRDYIWASELGGGYLDRYLKMNAVAPTNPPNPRSLRKFEAGNIWESIVGYVLRRAGIMQSRQEQLRFQYPDLLMVSGKQDFICGGKPDYDKAKATIHEEFNWLPEFISRCTESIVLKLQEQFPNGLPDILLEIKSCSAFMYEVYERNQAATPQHVLQLFHYLKCKNMPEGHVVYISKDDARMLEIPVWNPSATEEAYKKDITEMTYFVKNKIEPPKEQMIVWDKEFNKFSSNYKVAYSNYLTMLYGFENQFSFDTVFKPITERWNRVIGRIAEGKNMTDNNNEAIDEMAKYGFNIDEIKLKLKENK